MLAKKTKGEEPSLTGSGQEFMQGVRAPDSVCRVVCRFDFYGILRVR